MFIKVAIINFHGNRVMGPGETDSRTDMTTLIDAFHDCADVPKKSTLLGCPLSLLK